MKANSNFREQVGQVTAWFKDWSECEQTVALYSLLKKVSPLQARFLDQVLQQSLADCAHVKQLMSHANDDAFIAGLSGEDKGKVILQLLQLLPLLQAGKEKVKGAYLKLIPEVLSHTIENGVNIEESRQLLSYSLIHPAIGQDERSKLRMWLGYLEERFTYSISHTRPAPTPSQDPLPLPLPPMSVSPSSQEGLNHLVGPASASPCMAVAGNGWHAQAHHPAHYPPPEGGAVSSGGVGGGEGGAGGCSLNGHQALRVSNSHAGAFSVHLPPPHNSNNNNNTAANGHVALHATSSAPPNFDTMAASMPQGSVPQPNKHTPLHRTASLALGNPLALRVQNPEKLVTDWLQMQPGDPSGGMGRGRSPSLLEHAPLSPQSSVTSSGSGGSDCHHDDGPQPIRDSFLEEGSGMREVPVWLKTLRLHKYSYLFRQMTYEEMLSITEDWLEAQKVTKGARHKIVLSIQKLRGRQKVLCDFEKHVMEGGSIKEVLVEMKSMLNTPIKAYAPPPNCQNPNHLPLPQSPVSSDTEIAEGNLPGQFVRLMGKVCTQLLTARTLDDDCLQMYFQLIDKCVQHEAFSFRQKSLLSSWKQQAQRIWQPPPHKFDRRQKSWGNTFPLHTIAARTSSSGSRSRLMPCPGSGVQQWSFGSRRSVLGSSASNSHLPLSRNSSLTSPILGKPAVMETKQALSRTQSAPLRSSQLSLSSSIPPLGHEQVNDTEINARLDSLCLSMTEHALGGDSGDKGSTF